MNIIQKQKRAAILSCLILPQNGVADYGSRESSQQLAMGASMDSHNGNVVSSDAPKRPKNLVMSTVNGYATKSLREESEEIEDGSLPCTPELQLDNDTDVSSCPAGDEVLDSDTRQIISRFLRDYVGLSKPQWNESKALSTMKRVVEDVLEKHRYAYNGR